MSEGIRIAIDGPAACGKSTVARGVAERLGYAHLNSGLLYRAVTWKALEEEWIDEGSEEYRRRLEEMDLRLVREGGGFRVEVDGRRPGEELTSREVTRRVSEVAARPEVRRRVLEPQRRAGRGGGVVCEGRDIGTVVFPDAELKVFLTASPEERARRRLLDYGERPSEEKVREEAERLRLRDRKDSTRDAAPLRKARGAVEVDTTELSPREVVDRIAELARERGG